MVTRTGPDLSQARGRGKRTRPAQGPGAVTARYSNPPLLRSNGAPLPRSREWAATLEVRDHGTTGDAASGRVPRAPGDGPAAAADLVERGRCLAAAWRFAERHADVQRLGGLLGHP